MAHDHHQPCCGVSTNPEDYFLTRRQFLNRAGLGLGALSLATLLDPAHLIADPAAPVTPTAVPGGNSMLPRAPHFPGTAKSVIHIFAQGAPSHIDTWDPKPALSKMDGRELPGGAGIAMGSPFKFAKMGKSGIEVSEVFANLGQHIDDMAVIRSMYTDIPAHEV